MYGKSGLAVLCGLVLAVGLVPVASAATPFAEDFADGGVDGRTRAGGSCDTSGRPTGFASVNALGRNGTTGGAGGATVEVDTAAEFLAAVAMVEPLNICVRGMIALPGPMHDVASDKTIIGVGAGSGFTGEEPGQPDCSGAVEEPRAYYDYTLDASNDVRTIVMAGAGVGRI